MWKYNSLNSCNLLNNWFWLHSIVSCGTFFLEPTCLHISYCTKLKHALYFALSLCYSKSGQVCSTVRLWFHFLAVSPLLLGPINSGVVSNPYRHGRLFGECIPPSRSPGRRWVGVRPFRWGRSTPPLRHGTLPDFLSGLSPIARILSPGNPLDSGGQTYWLAACTRQVTSPSWGTCICRI